jgi:phage/plasmid-like protein (TIGR03299 family)
MISQLVSLDERAGTNVSAYNDIDDVLGAAGLNFNVETVPAHDPEGREVSGVNLIRREDTDTILGTCGNRYQVIDNRDMFKPFASVVDAHGATYESAGTVGDGRVNWISAKLPKDLTINAGKLKDKYEQRLVMLTYHDGLRRNSYFSFNKRVICNNMLSSLQRESSKGMGVRHTSNWEAGLSAAEQAFAESVKDMYAFKENGEWLAKQEMSEQQALFFGTRFFGKWLEEDERKKKNKDRSDRSKTIEQTKVATLMTLFTEGMGNEGKTRYDMLNAVTEYLDHAAVRKNTANGKRLLSNFNGTQRTLKNRALAELSRSDGYLELAA